MVKVACTFPGKNGDLLWSMPTIKEIAQKYGPVDFYMMPLYRTIAPLIEQQPYIRKAIPLFDWGLIGDVPGAQPVDHPPLPEEYDKEFTLGYRFFPDQFIPYFIANQSNISLIEPIYPFLEIEEDYNHYDVAIGFSGIYQQYPEYIDKFINPYKETLTSYGITWIDTKDGDWIQSAKWMKSSKVFIGDCSAPHVLAKGLNIPVILAESNVTRRCPPFISNEDYNTVVHCDNIMLKLDEFVKITREKLND